MTGPQHTDPPELQAWWRLKAVLIRVELEGGTSSDPRIRERFLEETRWLLTTKDFGRTP